ncbi:shikimate dehydrogenase [Synechocystis sp. PCC 7509]|uniref:shikimate dehydrogenase n=1 Tax=Synechocystis sp. PCC 7509 TaxID=927677 RepID=UPI0002AC5BB6|nr:shikimate dehydrogenase [Synechocystis sp. PCC 7509]
MSQIITGKTKLLGVIGHPVEHSLSPIMHNAAIAHLGLDYVYLPLPVHPDNLQAAISGFAAIDLVGFNITIPHKQAITPLITEISATAKAIGAINTVWRTSSSIWAGTNTDVEGFITPLQTYAQNWSEKTALVLGNGGAARAVVAGCAQLGFKETYVVGRNPTKLAEFIASWGNSALATQLLVRSWDKLPLLIPQAKVIINTTPIGMYPNVRESPLSDEEMGLLAADAIAYDLIYTPSPTKFLQQAQAKGATAIDGLEMLVQQGAAALKIWLQQPAPIDVMRQALQNYLSKG